MHRHMGQHLADDAGIIIVVICLGRRIMGVMRGCRPGRRQSAMAHVLRPFMDELPRPGRPIDDRQQDHESGEANDHFPKWKTEVSEILTIITNAVNIII